MWSYFWLVGLVLGTVLRSVLSGLFHLCGLGYRSQRQLHEGQDCPTFVLEFTWRSCKWCDSLAWTLQPRSWSRWISLENHCRIFFFNNSFALSRSFHAREYQLYRINLPKLIERKCNILGKFNSVKKNGLQSLLHHVILYESSAQVSLDANDKNLKSIWH